MWVFGYGSLIWKPGFDPAETILARLPGYARSFCMRSIHHRGSVEKPGLVLALDQRAGAVCDGLALAAHDDQADAVLAYLRERELVTHVYLERVKQVQLADGRRVNALCYVIDRTHHQYAGHLHPDEALPYVRTATGISGPNIEYVLNTVDHLKSLGIRDHWLESVARLLRE